MSGIASKIRELVAQYDDYVIAARRRVHVFAEISGKEYKTSDFIENELMSIGLSVEKVSNTGLIGVLDTGLPGSTIALRADIDALPISEHQFNLSRERICISENENTCHACGHDAHTAMLIGAAKVLSMLKGLISGKVLFCFEEGEEMGLGVKPMLNALSKRHIDSVLATHVLSTLEAGKINVSPGPRMAGGRRILMRINGKGGHGSRPDLSINPVYAAAAITTNITGALQNVIDPDNPVTVGITSIQGGSAENIFPDYADIKGTLRFFDFEEGLKVAQTIRVVAKNTAEMLGCFVEFDPAMDWHGLPVINDSTVSQRAAGALSLLGYYDALAHSPPWYGAESFSSYLAKYPGALMFLGIKNDNYGSGAPHHNEMFDVDESVLALGVAAMSGYVVYERMSSE